MADLVDGLVRLFHSAEPDPLNFGNPAKRTIRDKVTAVERILGRRPS